MEQGRQMRFNDEELDLIKRTFKGNESLLFLLRKVFLPEFSPGAPLGQGIDLWMTVDVRGKQPNEAMVNILARNELIMHVEQMLLQLRSLAEMTDETPEAKEKRQKKDSTK